jgi:hypothetical protein
MFVSAFGVTENGRGLAFRKMGFLASDARIFNDEKRRESRPASPCAPARGRELQSKFLNDCRMRVLLRGARRKVSQSLARLKKVESGKAKGESEDRATL